MTSRAVRSVFMLCALLVVCGEATAQNTASSDADLSGLTLSAGTLDPAFARDSLAYTAIVANSTTSLTVTPTSNHSGAAITVNGTSVSSGSASSGISLSVGENTITIVVTAEDNTTTKTYTVTVVRGVDIPDGYLRAAIKLLLQKSSGAIITPSDMATLTRLSLLSRSITYLDGLEYATSLTNLALGLNYIRDLSALSGLTSLTRLELAYNRIYDISALSGLTSLTRLYLNRNNISDISALSGLTSLTELDLAYNRIYDISALSGLTSLTELNLRNNLLNYPSLTTHISAHQSRGVRVIYDTRTLTSLVKISGDDQTGTAGTRLSAPFIVEVRDENDVAFAGVPVAFSVTAGGGVLSTTTGTTDANGRASTRLTLGTAGGVDTVVAAIDVSDIDKSVTFTATTPPPPTADADLSGLTLSAGTLAPAFARHSLAYTATVSNSTTSLTVTPTSNHSGAAITVNGTSVSSGSASSSISLSVGENTITIVVTAEDNTTTKTYTVTVARDVNIPDGNLRYAISNSLRKSYDAIILPSEMATLTYLDTNSKVFKFISDLTGLEHATSLTTLDLGRNNISDISALSGLTSLTRLDLGRNNISDISALSGLTSLRELDLHYNNISDISALSGLTSLGKLDLTGTSITDISALSGLTSLRELYISGTSITDKSVLSGLTSLEILNLWGTGTTDISISVLSGLTSLIVLDLGRNNISNISALSGLTSLRSLKLAYTSVSDISPLSGLKLTYLGLDNSAISDISALSDLTYLEVLDLSDTSVSDISPLSGLTDLETLLLRTNLLSYPSLTTHIPALQSRGVYVLYETRTVTSLVKISGDDQTGTAGTRLSAPLIVEVRDENDVAFAGVPVAFSVSAGGGSLSTTTDATDADGRASTRLTLGATGVDTVVAAIDVSGIDKSVTFTATATGATAERAAISSTVPASLTEENLDGATVNITLTGTTYNETLAASHFALHTAPQGASISGTPVRTSATVAQLTLAYAGLGFDTSQNLRVTVKAEAHSGSEDLTTGSVTVTPVQGPGTGPVTVVTELGQVTGVAVLPGVGYLAVSWNVVTGATGYKVQWKSGDKVYASDRQQAIDNGGKTSTTIAGLTAGTQYTVRVIATKTDADDGSPSVGVTGTPTAGTQPPTPPPSPPDTTASARLPSFGSATVTAQRYRTGTTVSITLPQATGGDGTLTYALKPDLPSGLKFDATTRVLSGTPRELMGETEYTLTATDADGDATALTFTISVAVDSGTSLGDSTRVAAQRYIIGDNVRVTLPEATGGALTYTLKPDLPSGLTFDAKTRVLSGTPREVMGETEYTLTATDSEGDATTLTFTISVIAVADRLPSFNDSIRIAAQRYIIGYSIRVTTLPEATGGDGTLVYILWPSLPNGLRFDSATRTISGTPRRELTETEYTLSAVDADGDIASLTFTLKVQPLTVAADFNDNGRLDFDDMWTFAFYYLARRGEARYEARCDLDNDGEVGYSDFLIFAPHLEP